MAEESHEALLAFLIDIGAFDPPTKPHYFWTVEAGHVKACEDGSYLFMDEDGEYR